MAKPPTPHARQEDFEAPTQKRTVPAELREPHALVTTKLRRAEIDSILLQEGLKNESGMRTAVTSEDIERFERREQRETIPAPPEAPQLPDDVADLDADDKR